MGQGNSFNAKFQIQNVRCRLGHDLKIDERTLQQTVLFHKSFPIATARSELSKDKYDRYLADIFIGSKEIFLNQKLLDEKLAVGY